MAEVHAIEGDALRTAGGVIVPAQRLGAGGEGEVFAVEGEPALALKLYRDKVRVRREAKIVAMVAADLAATTNTIAFPLSEVRDSSGAFAGFTMPRVPHARSLHELTSPASRRTMFPQAGVAFLVRTALNTVRAVAAVHAAGCVIGDINHSGLLITDDARVILIDADSFQVRADGTLFPCEVGVPEYTPPELIGRALANVERTPDHDAFGLAVVVFQLLFLGRHPYAGVARGPRISVDEAMRAHRFAYSARPTGLSPPPAALTLNDWPDEIGALFEAAFAPGGARPSAAAWVEALSRAEAALSPCDRDPLHARPTAAACPFCRVETDAKTALFSPAAPPRAEAPPFDPAAARAALDAIALPEALAYAPPPLPDDAPPPAPPRRRMAPRALKWATAVFAIGSGSWLAYLAPQSFVMLLIVAWGAITWLRVPRSAPARQELATLDREIARTVAAIQADADLDAAWLAKADAEAALAERTNLAATIEETEQHFRAERAELARQRILADHPITAAPISAGAVDALEGAGVRNAGAVLRRNMAAVEGLPARDAMALENWARAAAAAVSTAGPLTDREMAELSRRKAAVAARAPHLEQRLDFAIERLTRAAESVAAVHTRREPTLDTLLSQRASLEMEIEGYGETPPDPPSPAARPLRPETRARLKALAPATRKLAG